jgi:uncharacterized repeat protein (TIGR03803 family)
MSKNTVINNGLIINNGQIITGITNDSGFTLNSEYVLPTQQAIKSYVDYKVSNISGGTGESYWNRSGTTITQKNVGDTVFINGKLLVNDDITPNTSITLEYYSLTDSLYSSINSNLIYFDNYLYTVTINGEIIQIDPKLNSLTYINNCSGQSYAGFTLYNNKLYNITANGGLYSYGYIYEYNPLNNTITSIYDFNYYNITNSQQTLLLINDKLYGSFNEGGIVGYGLIFEYDLSLSSFLSLWDLSNSDYKIESPLEYYNGKLYGTFSNDGNSPNYGSIFEYDFDILTLTEIYQFDNTNGSRPKGKFIINNGIIYGTCDDGGSNNYGVIYQYDITNNIYIVLHRFNLTGGTNCIGGVLLNNNKLYGSCYSGGTYGYGTIFEYDLELNIFTKLKDFNQYDAANSKASLIIYDNTLYGTSESGGTYQYGSIFKLKLKDLTIGNSDNYFYNIYLNNLTLNNTTVEDISNDSGLTLNSEYILPTQQAVKYYIDSLSSLWKRSGTTITQKYIDDTVFINGELLVNDKIKPNTSLTFDYYSLTNSSYTYLYAGLIYFDNYFYTVTYLGEIIKFDPKLNNLTYINNCQGKSIAGFTLYNNKLYNATDNGGLNEYGYIYEYIPSANTITILHEFDYSTEGYIVENSLLAINDKLYGMTENGSSYSNGALFEYNLNTSTLNVLYSFDSVNYQLTSSLNYNNNNLYGTFLNSDNGYGSIFEFNLSNSSLTVLYEFNYIDGNSPRGNIIINNGLIYGTCYAGGSKSGGVIYKYDITGNTYTVLYNFNSTGGTNCYSGVILDNNKLYGTCYIGGTYGYGTIFEYDLNSNLFTKLKDFNQYDAAHPRSSLIKYNNSLYGTSYNGGSYQYGSIFKQEIIKELIIGDTNNHFNNIYIDNLTLKNTIITGITNDSGFTLNSDYLLSTQKAIKSYVDYKVSNISGGTGESYWVRNDTTITQKYAGDTVYINGNLTLKNTIITGITNDSGFTLNSDYLLSTQKAIKSYVDYKVSIFLVVLENLIGLEIIQRSLKNTLEIQFLLMVI